MGLSQPYSVCFLNHTMLALGPYGERTASRTSFDGRHTIVERSQYDCKAVVKRLSSGRNLVMKRSQKYK